MEQAEFDKIMMEHALWLANPNKGKRADFSNTSGRREIFHLYLSGRNYRRANFSRAFFRGANFVSANLQEVNFNKTELVEANLRNANLTGAYLVGAFLNRASLYKANLRNADLRGADLSDAELLNATFEGANLEGATLPNFQIVPEEGPFIAWKKVDGAILKLEILGERTSVLSSRQCRTSKARVLAGYTPSARYVHLKDAPSWDALPTGTVLKSLYEKDFAYTIGEIVEEKEYSNDIRIEYGKGIHFFMTIKEARAFRL